MSNFPLEEHTWQVFVISHHGNDFCFSGHCLCHDKDFEGFHLPYSILKNKLSLVIHQVKENCVKYDKIPLDISDSERHVKKLQDFANKEKKNE